MKRIHIIGRKNSGKTTLITEIVQELTRRGRRVGTIKHTHHHHELDTPGKDSHRHREAGAAAVGVLSRGLNAIFWPQRSEEGKSNAYQQFEQMMRQCDIVLVEGDSQTDAPKIEVFRVATESELMAKSDPTIRAVITDDVLDIKIPVWSRDDLSLIVDNIESLVSTPTGK